MKTKVNLEFISKVYEVSEKMQDLATFWYENKEALKDTNVSKDYPFNKSFDELTFNVSNWFLTLIDEYCENK